MVENSGIQCAYNGQARQIEEHEEGGKPSLTEKS